MVEVLKNSKFRICGGGGGEAVVGCDFNELGFIGCYCLNDVNCYKFYLFLVV